MTVNDWQDWKHNPVTKMFYEACMERIDDMKEILAVSAGNDSNNDSFNRGFIHAYREMLDFRFDDSFEDFK